MSARFGVRRQAVFRATPLFSFPEHAINWCRTREAGFLTALQNKLQNQ